jgi:hypothetical protein
MVIANGNAIKRKARLTLLIAVTPGRTSERTPREVVMIAMTSPQLVKNLSKPDMAFANKLNSDIVL